MQAKIFFGSTEAVKENFSERKSPFNGEVVSQAPTCNADDAKKSTENCAGGFKKC